MSIQGVQLIYRLRTTIRLFIDYRTNVDSFNLYYSNILIGPYTFLKTISNIASKIPSTRGKIVFEFDTLNLIGWNNDTLNYIKLTQIINGIEGNQEGPLEVPTRLEKIIPKEFSVIYGLDYGSQKFVPISVDSSGKLITV
jgi:hypothetical protein